MAEHLFMYRDEKLNTKKVMSILKPDLAPIGNHRRQSQEIVLGKCVAFLKSTEGKSVNYTVWYRVCWYMILNELTH